MAVVSNAASSAALEASTGAWSQELRSGKLPRILAPGMPYGLFGAWQLPGKYLQDPHFNSKFLCLRPCQRQIRVGVAAGAGGRHEVGLLPEMAVDSGMLIACKGLLDIVDCPSWLGGLKSMSYSFQSLV